MQHRRNLGYDSPKARRLDADLPKLGSVRSGGSYPNASTSWQDLRPLPIRQPSGRDTERLGERIEYVDASLCAFLDVGQCWRTEISQTGQRCFRDSLLFTSAPQSRAHSRHRCLLSV